MSPDKKQPKKTKLKLVKPAEAEKMESEKKALPSVVRSGLMSEKKHAAIHATSNAMIGGIVESLDGVGDDALFGNALSFTYFIAHAGLDFETSLAKWTAFAREEFAEAQRRVAATETA